MHTLTASKGKNKVADKIGFPSASYRGIDIPGSKILKTLYSDFGTSEEAYNLAPKSSPLSLKAGLYLIGRDLAYGIGDADSLPEPVKEAGRLVYEYAQQRKGRGVCHKDGVIIELNATIPGNIRPGEDYVVGIYFQNIRGFKKKGDGSWDIDTLPETREEKIWLPEGGGSFIVPTRYGSNNRLGLPDETIEDENEAIKRWVDAGFTEEQARKELSRFYKRNQGTAAVLSWSDNRDGPLGVYLVGEPDRRSSGVGSFPASSPAERSEAPKNSGYKLLTKEEYQGYVEDRKTLEKVRNDVNK